MPEHSPTSRDFGILPQDLPAPSEKVRCFCSPGRIIGQYIGTGLVSAVGVGLAVLFALTLPMPVNLLGSPAILAAFGAFVYVATHNDYRWVELEGNTLRAKHLYTGRIIERSLDDVECLATMFYRVRWMRTVIMKQVLGPVRGIEVRFRDRRTPLRITRANPAMTNAQEIIEAVLYRMGQMRPLDDEVGSFAGQPVVRYVRWKDEPPGPLPKRNLKVSLCWLILIPLLVGIYCGYGSLEQQNRHQVLSVPPHEISLQSLIQNGPGDNRHVTITGFRPGGYAVETKHSSWVHVWIALFPADMQPAECKEIKVVLKSNAVRDEAGLRRLLEQGRVTGICSESPKSFWGLIVKPKLVEANQGRPLSAAWAIEEMREPPSEAPVIAILATSAGCFTAVLLLAANVFRLKS